MLAFVPLMQGAGEAAIIDRWVRAASALPNEVMRRELAALGAVFATLVKRVDQWKPAWRAVTMQQTSEFLDEFRDMGRVEGRVEGRDMGRVEGRAESILDFLDARFGPPPPEVAVAVRAVADPARLRELTAAAARVASLDEFRAAL